jgi:hypothetical protein
MCDIWINVLIHTSTLVGPLYRVIVVQFTKYLQERMRQNNSVAGMGYIVNYVS